MAEIENNIKTLSWTDQVYASLLALLVFASRYFLRGSLYFVDGPSIVRSIQQRTYIIQPPCYWLYAHLGGLFHDPVAGLAFWNEAFSVAGVVVFFFLCRRLGLTSVFSALASLAYSSVFFVWFSGEVHSSYASQILFGPLIVYSFLRYQDKPSLSRLLLCAASFAIGTGLRPSDGVFLGCLCVYLLFTCITKPSHRVILVLCAAIICLGWYLPTRAALLATHGGSIFRMQATSKAVSPLVVGITARSIGNVVRVILPVLVAFWMLLPSIFTRRTARENWMLALWIIPGMIFFLLVYMADATYLTFLSGAVILMAALSQNRRLAAWSLAICIVFNTALFLGAHPVNADGNIVRAYNFYIVKCCDYGIRHQWMSTIGNGGQIPH